MAIHRWTHPGNAGSQLSNLPICVDSTKYLATDYTRRRALRRAEHSTTLETQRLDSAPDQRECWSTCRPFSLTRDDRIDSWTWRCLLYSAILCVYSAILLGDSGDQEIPRECMQVRTVIHRPPGSEGLETSFEQL